MFWGDFFKALFVAVFDKDVTLFLLLRLQVFPTVAFTTLVCFGDRIIFLNSMGKTQK